MSQPTPVDYGHGGENRRFSRAAIVALLVGLFCGPAAVGVVVILWERPPFLLGVTGGAVVLVISHLASIAFSASIFFSLKRPGRRRGTYLALIGLLATLGWAIALILYLSQTWKAPFG
jgi:hypothetical protein